MKLRTLFFALVALCPFYSIAQSSLTIFSEDGYKFYLILNGQKQNEVAMTNVRIDGLPQPQYATRIIFEDASKPEISKNIPVVDPGTSTPADVTYKIKTNNKGELKIRYFSATPVQPNYLPPPDVYVMHYGQPAPPPPSGTTVTQTTVTQTSGVQTGTGMNVNVGLGGVNMNVNINDPVMNGGTVTSTTTTTTTSTDVGYGFDGGGSNYRDAPPPPPPARGNNRGGGCRFAMDASSFRSAKETVTKASFDETKLSTAKTILTSNCMNTDQIMQICKLFSFEESMLDFAKFAYGRSTDPGNYFKVGNVFTFDASRTELNEYIGGQ